jgi:hypothetical protein
MRPISVLLVLLALTPGPAAPGEPAHPMSAPALPLPTVCGEMSGRGLCAPVPGPTCTRGPVLPSDPAQGSQPVRVCRLSLDPSNPVAPAARTTGGQSRATVAAPRSGDGPAPLSGP